VTRRRATLGLLAGVVSAAAFALAPRAPLRADEKTERDGSVLAARQQLVGEWRLNPELSEDPREKMRQARAGGGRPEGGGPPGGYGGGGWGHHGGGHGGYAGHGGAGGQGGPPGEGTRPARSILFTASRITVTNLVPEVTMLEPDGEVRRLHPDGAAYKDEAGDEIKTKWDASRLVVETESRGGSMKETWSVADDPRRLTVLVEVKRSYGGEVKVRRVFDPVASDAPAP
jgi:hypothetical protein